MSVARLLTGDCRTVLPTLDAESIDAVVTDPPYGLAFMGKAWDHGVPGVEFWTETLRVAKPGAHLVAFGGSRTFHRLACAIEDAGWEVRDCLSWLYGSGFPKSHNGPWGGTALKPAWEPIILARKPLDGTVAENFAAHGTGALNIDGCRIATPDGKPHYDYLNGPGGNVSAQILQGLGSRRGKRITAPASGRWPANVVLDEAAAEMLGEPSRFFYCAKASRSEREAGLTGPERSVGSLRLRTDSHAERTGNTTTPARNHHPTVKPIAIMRWLVRLVTPAGGTVLDPFMGSGTTGIAAALEGAAFVGIEREPEYGEIARRRIDHASVQVVLPLGGGA